jgi:tRNA dimethylallyltransferase
LKNKTVIIIVGPTAVGKTSVAVHLAQTLQTKIISADSRQCFKELNIAVAKPSPEELRLVPHYFISSHSIDEDVNAGLFEQLSLQWADEIFQQSNIAVMVGGTGLYIKSFCEGFDNIPDIDPSVRKKIQDQYKERGIGWLQEEIKTADSEYYASAETLNPQRLMRALEIKLSTGQSILAFRSQQKKQRTFNIKKIGLHLPKEQLHQHINFRVDEMIRKGLIDEVKELLPYKNLNALQTVGYTELFDYLDNKINLEEAIERIKKNTRHYAKRQMTWFKKDQSIQWIDPSDFEQLKKIAESL